MKKLRFILLLCLPLFSAGLSAEEEALSKEGVDYFAFSYKLMDFRALGAPRKASIWASELTAGTYIADNFVVEGRAGWGWEKEKIDLDVTFKGGLKYWASWYMGVVYPLADFFEVYGKFGFSHVMGVARFYPKREDDNDFGVSEVVSDEFLTSTFSASWNIGADYQVTDNLFINMEIGRLHEDTTTDIKTYHSGLGIKYQY